MPLVPGPSVPQTGDRAEVLCRTSDLTVGFGPATGAAGTMAFPIVFTNAGSRPCVLQGFPGVSYATGPDSAPVGAPAARDGAASGPVLLSPGEQASALVFATDVGNIPEEQCRPVPVPGLRIYPPDNTASLYLEHDGTACSLEQASTTQLRVRAIVAGPTGQ
ncbi:DUF4232 domain-containing protein [Nocardia transvalensis]|uniref:DUF4232 domain-containing protein n=1 Tax=Nocardia transvalensis TaxID=37333 RepID=UPI001894ADBA|nr:DUF4232 domain-containing protein [Nocardia transvalensis]MBF6330356.1 DUF4232 domain-containing protein [Nocardia transvalensis]